MKSIREWAWGVHVNTTAKWTMAPEKRIVIQVRIGGGQVAAGKGGDTGPSTTPI
jgi:hypothetical protein